MTTNKFMEIYRGNERKQREITLTNLMDCVRRAYQTWNASSLVSLELDSLFLSDKPRKVSKINKGLKKLQIEHEQFKIVVREMIDNRRKLINLLANVHYEHLPDHVCQYLSTKIFFDHSNGSLPISMYPTNLIRLVDLVINTSFERLNCQYRAMAMITTNLLLHSSNVKFRLSNGGNNRSIKLIHDVWDGTNNPDAQFNCKVNELLHYFIY